MKKNYNDENHVPQAYFLFVNILLNLLKALPFRPIESPTGSRL